MFGTFSNSKTQPASASNSTGPALKRGHVIVIGNEKGGSGKTTTTMHLIVALLRLGFKIGSIDIDSRQRSLTRYVENRQAMLAREGVKLPVPQHMVVTRSPFNMQEEAEADERERFSRAINTLLETNDFVVIDSPGSDTYLSRFAHSFADTIITPINDSFVDLDVLANVDGSTLKIVRPSIYSEMVWEQKLLRAKRDGGSIEWIVMRNRLSNIDARNKRFMGQVLAELSRRIGFRAAPGFSERVIFREMFLQGLTVLDVMDNGANTSLSLSHVAARQEVRDLLKTLRIPAIDERVGQMRGVDNEPSVATPATNAEMPAATPTANAAPARAPAPAAAPVAIRPAMASPTPAAPARPAPPVMQAIGRPASYAPPPPPAAAPVAAAPSAPTMPQTIRPAATAPVAVVPAAPRPVAAPTAAQPVSAQPSISPSANRPTTAPSTSSTGSKYLMSSEMLQQAASAIRQAANHALQQNRTAMGTAAAPADAADVPPAPRNLEAAS